MIYFYLFVFFLLFSLIFSFNISKVTRVTTEHKNTYKQKLNFFLQRGKIALGQRPKPSGDAGTTVLGPIGVNVRKSYLLLEILPPSWKSIQPGWKSIQPGWKSIHPGWKSNCQTAWKSYRWLGIFPPIWLDF